jgi:hypothetical protein
MDPLRSPEFPRCPITKQQVSLDLGALMATKAVLIRCPSCGAIHRLEPGTLHFASTEETPRARPGQGEAD